MTARHASELLYDSEAALRLVDHAIEEIRETDGRRGVDNGDVARAAQLRDALAAANGPLGVVGLSQILARGYTEIVSVLGSLRESRTVLERATVERLQQTHAKIREVTKTTEVAAADIMAGLERSVTLVDEMDARADEGNAAAGADLRNTLRDELFGVMGFLQFQDITTQQLNYASSVLTEMENRLAELASVLDPTAFGVTRLPTPTPATPSVLEENAAARQAVADEIFRNDDGR